MDHAVAQVVAGLQINGDFPVAGYPVTESIGKHSALGLFMVPEKAPCEAGSPE